MRVQFAAVSGLLAACIATSATAAACRDTKNVKDSTASAAKNQDAGGKGGHVNLHMKNATSPLPPSGDQSQLKKTAFKDWATFKKAFDTWAGGKVKPGDIMIGPKTCGGSSGSQKDCIKASAIGVTEAWTCKAVNDKGICTDWTKLSGELYVGFWYANSPGASGTGGKWLVNTAYPSTNSDCN